MSYIKNVLIAGADSPSIDAFARLRTSIPLTLFDSKFPFDNGTPLFWDDARISGAGTTSVWTSGAAIVTMSVSGSVAGVHVRQTKRRFNYQPGKSQLAIFTSVMGTGSTAIKKRIGMFDSNNGLFFEVGSSLSIVRRSSTTGTTIDTGVTQASWNKDKLDGTGNSGITLDLNTGNIFFIDYEWLGFGRVRFGIFHNGLPIVCHEMNHDNTLSVPYIGTPNLPMRFEINNSGSGSAASLSHVCTTIIKEGGTLDTGGANRSINNGNTPRTTGAGSTDVVPLLSIRLKSSSLGATIIPEFLHLLCTTTSNYRWALMWNPSYGGTDTASWVDLDNSNIQYDVSRTQAVTGGIQLFSGYVTNNLDQAAVDIRSALLLGATIAGVRDELVVTVQNLAAGNETYYCSLDFREVL